MIEKIFPETLSILSSLIKFQTTSGSSNLELINYCEEKLKKSGAVSFKTFNETKSQANLFSTINGIDKTNSRGIILSGHTDVVPAESSEWTSDPFKIRKKDNKIYGRGTCDMKGFIACTLAVAPLFASKN